MSEESALESGSNLIYNLKCFNHLNEKYLVKDSQSIPELHPEAKSEVIFGPKRGLAIDLQVLDQNPYVCIVCGTDFGNRTALHIHQLKHYHLIGQADQKNKSPLFQCRQCGNTMGLHNLNKHRCFIKEQDHIKHLEKVLNRDGSAMVCILCRGRILPSRIHLILHLIVAHSVHRHPFRCVFCHARFRSENLMMQEAHAFEYHAPELFILNRKACFKVLRDPKGLILDTSVPFTCLYDSAKMETVNYMDLTTKALRAAKRLKSDKDLTGEGMANRENLQSQQQQSKEAEGRVCTARFKCLAEFTTHVCCFHGAVMPPNGLTDEGDDQEDAEENLTNLQMPRRDGHVPGPTVREMLKSQEAGFHAKQTTSEEDLNTDSAQRKNLPSSTKKVIRPNTVDSKPLRLAKEQCRVCLERFETLEKLKDHAVSQHFPAMRKRLEHLVEKDHLSGMLDLDRLCPECYALYPDGFSLQVHMVVCHTGKDWRHCGLCDYEFFSEDSGNPSHLRLMPYSVSVLDKESIPNFQESNQNAPNIWPLSSELMWRVIMAHESRHRNRLFQPKEVPYMPIALFERLITTEAIQSGLAANWILKKVKQEVEGFTDEMVDSQNDLFGPSTAQEAFIDKQTAVKSTTLDRQIVIDAMEALSTITEQTEQPQTLQLACNKQKPPQLSSILNNEDEQKKSDLIRRSEKHSCYSGPQYQLPNFLIKAFTEIGEQNITKQAEMDFEENS